MTRMTRIGREEQSFLLKTWLRAAHSRHSRLNDLVLGSDENDFSRFDEFQFFPSESFDGIGIAAKGLDFLGELFVLSIHPVDFGFNRSEFFRLGVYLKYAFIVEDGEQKHRDCEQSEYAKSDSNNDALHQVSVIHCFPYSKSESRSSMEVDSA